MNKKLRKNLTYLTAFTLLNATAAPAYAASKLSNKLREPVISGAFEQRISFHSTGSTMHGDRTYIVGPVEISNLGTYEGKGASFKVLYKENDINNAKKLMLKEAKKANPLFNHSDLVELLNQATPNSVEAKAIQDAFGSPDSLVNGYNITKPELGKILSTMKLFDHNSLPVIIRYETDKQSGLWMPIFDSGKTKKWMKDGEPVQPKAEEVHPTIIKKGISPWLAGGIVLVVGGVTYAIAHHDGYHDGYHDATESQSNGTIEGGDIFKR